ncbi:MAG: GNAT family N-acetyltransferase [Chloroflexi bacterium]|nr:GNAT family N-acetyltransferase [Chloroflexota bacterium]MCC6895017.1 GNAT family N-acetyltransferase [Anaerolineae bacterium]
MPAFTVTPAQSRDYNRILNLIQHVTLLTEGILAAGTRYWVVETASGELAACAGLEFGSDAVLFRSLAVYEAYRGDGLARRLIDHALNEAQAEGYHHAYCFSTRAADYFSRLGFREVPVAQLAAALPDAPQVKHFAMIGKLAGERAWWKALTQETN